MAKFVRASKFRHIFGKPEKKDKCYDAIRMSRISWDSKFCAVNLKFVAVITESGGGSAFMVLPLEQTGRVDINAPQVYAHKGPVYDIAWSPHDDNMIASCSDDCSIKIWQIPDGGLTENMTEPLLSIEYHQRRVTSILWHPTAQNILLSTGSDNITCLWDLETGQSEMEVSLPDQVFSMSFNEDGSRFACTCKDKKLRVLNTRTGEMLQEVHAHDGTKPQQCAFLKNNKVLTTGFSKMSERQYALWDAAKPKMEQLEREDIDSSNGVNFIFYDPDLSLFYLVGKGDSVIRYYEITEDAPYIYWLSNYSTKEPQRGCGWMPKRGLNPKSCEIARFFKLHNQGLCEVIPMIVPRKSELFQDDLYPPTASIEPALKADEFVAGKDAMPIMMCLKPDDVKGSQKPTTGIVRRTNLGAEKTPAKAAVSSTNASQEKDTSSNGTAEPAAPAVAPAAALPPKSVEGMDDLKKEIDELKKIVSKQDKRIEALEGRVSQLEQRNDTDEEDAGEVA